MRVATIDIGTNSVLLLIAEVTPGGLRPIVEQATITRLGQRVDASGELAPEARERTLACLAGYAASIRGAGVDATAAVGTSAMRDAGGAFVDEVSLLLDTKAEVISGPPRSRADVSGLAVWAGGHRPAAGV